MDILSYRGPSQPGGVSALIKHAFDLDNDSTWWHLHNSCLYSRCAEKLTANARISPNVIRGHYRYCNEYLWPLMHGRFDLARYQEMDKNCYRSLNMVVASPLNMSASKERSFIHDYQFAFAPYYMSEIASLSSVFFWHIPWPNSCPTKMAEDLKEIARGLLCCGTIGFHIENYVNNFANFVREHLPEYSVLPDNSGVIHNSGKFTELKFSPAGIDWGFWNNQAAQCLQSPLELPYILSVDRADYTKGIAEKISAIRIFFRKHPEYFGKIQFVFISQPTRKGLSAFDNYWDHCRANYEATNAEFATDDWSPILWLTDPVAPEELASWYAHASAMLVTPVIDGLNLTAKEFAASSVKPDSSLILSRGAGVWHELGRNSVTVDDCHPERIAEAIRRALADSPERKQSDLRALKRAVRNNSLEKWWQSLLSQKCIDVAAS